MTATLPPTTTVASSGWGRGPRPLLASAGAQPASATSSAAPAPTRTSSAGPAMSSARGTHSQYASPPPAAATAIALTRHSSVTRATRGTSPVSARRRTERLVAGPRPARYLHRRPGRAEAEPRVEPLRPVLVVGGDPQVARVPRRRDRCDRQRGAASVATVLGVYVDLGDLGALAGPLDLREPDRPPSVVRRQHARPPQHRDLARLTVIAAGDLVGVVLPVPGEAQVVHGVVGDLLDASVRDAGRRLGVAHP